MRLISVTIGLMLVVGCASPSVQLCREAARCEDRDPDQCVDDARDADDEASELGCGSTARALARCLDRHGSCEDGQYVIDVGECSEEASDNVSCLLENGLGLD